MRQSAKIKVSEKQKKIIANSSTAISFTNLPLLENNSKFVTVPQNPDSTRLLKTKTDLTFEKLKLYKGFENTSESEAEKQIEVIKKLAKTLHYLYISEEQNKSNYEKRP